MKHLKKRKLNNKGLSLVEILVTVVIIALISAPVINSFMHAIQVNSKARTIQNGTSVAQDTAEYFKVFDVKTLIDLYKPASGTSVDTEDTEHNWNFKNKETGVEVYYEKLNGKEYGKYIFKGIPVKGADGETFLVDVTLDPSVYSDGTKYTVNDQRLPVLSALYGSDSIMLFSQYAGPDESLVDLFTGKLGSNETYILNNINSYKERKNVQKSTVIDVDCYNLSTGKTSYDVKVTTTYVYKNIVTATVTEEVQKTFNKNEMHSVYMLCPIFDLYSTDTDINGNFKSSDKITIDYTYIGDNNAKKDFLFYIAEQDMLHVDPSDGIINQDNKKQRINSDNITIIYNTADEMSPTVVSQVFKCEGYNEYVNNKIANTNLKVYTNIGKETSTNNYGLTYGQHNTFASMYNMEVSVKLKGRDDIVATFNTAK